METIYIKQVIESFNQPNLSKTLIHSAMKQVTDFESTESSEWFTCTLLDITFLYIELHKSKCF